MPHASHIRLHRCASRRGDAGDWQRSARTWPAQGARAARIGVGACVTAHKQSSASSARARPAQGARAACLGVGAGALPRFLIRRAPGLAVDAVELDPAVAAAARECFGFPPPQARRRGEKVVFIAAACLLAQARSKAPTGLALPVASRRPRRAACARGPPARTKAGPPAQAEAGPAVALLVEDAAAYMARLAARARVETLTLPAGGPEAAKRPSAVSAVVDCRGSALQSGAACPGGRVASPAGSNSRQAPAEERPVRRGPRWAAPVRRRVVQAGAARAQSGGCEACVPEPCSGVAPSAAKGGCRPGVHEQVGVAAAGPRSAAPPCAAAGGGGCSAAHSALPLAATAAGFPAAASDVRIGRLAAVFLDAFDGRGEVPVALQARPPLGSIVRRVRRCGSAWPNDRKGLSWRQAGAFLCG